MVCFLALQIENPDYIVVFAYLDNTVPRIWVIAESQSLYLSFVAMPTDYPFHPLIAVNTVEYDYLLSLW